VQVAELSTRQDLQKQPTLTRREIVQKLLGAMAAAGAFPLIATSHPIYRHLTSAVMFDRAEEMRVAADWQPLFLNGGQDKTLAALSEIMVPGSATAHVNRFVDLLVSVDTAQHQREFVASLAAIEDEANQRFAKGFEQLTPSEQETLLTDFSTQESHREQFHNLKGWIVGAYYSSEQGMRELGWNGNYAFESYPSCEHGDGHS
jgi:gluconate 2-dehydrogenase subunit 3-like protein